MSRSILICLLVVIFGCEPAKQVKQETEEESSKATPTVTEKEEKEASYWETEVVTNEMTGRKIYLLKSPAVFSTKKMQGMWSTTKGRLVFSCWLSTVTGKPRVYESLYTEFKPQVPIIKDIKTISYNPHISGFTTTIKWDDVVRWQEFTQESGSYQLRFEESQKAIAHSLSAREMLLALHWYNHDYAVYFRFSLEGWTEAVEGLRKNCAPPEPPPPPPPSASTSSEIPTKDGGSLSE